MLLPLLEARMECALLIRVFRNWLYLAAFFYTIAAS
ncbi:MAG: hypothetical protein QOH31_4471 [Verrucomicrobiota bacterium]